MDTGGYTALDPSRQSYQLQREGSLAFKGPNILTATTRVQPAQPPAQTAPPKRPFRSSDSHAANKWGPLEEVHQRLTEIKSPPPKR